jgi:hypothetical protein
MQTKYWNNIPHLRVFLEMSYRGGDKMFKFAYM